MIAARMVLVWGGLCAAVMVGGCESPPPTTWEVMESKQQAPAQPRGWTPELGGFRMSEPSYRGDIPNVRRVTPQGLP